MKQRRGDEEDVRNQETNDMVQRQRMVLPNGTDYKEPQIVEDREKESRLGQNMC